MWCKASNNRYFCKIKNYAYGEIKERSFCTPNLWSGGPLQQICGPCSPINKREQPVHSRTSEQTIVATTCLKLLIMMSSIRKGFMMNVRKFIYLFGQELVFYQTDYGSSSNSASCPGINVAWVYVIMTLNISSCAHKWVWYTPALSTTCLIQKCSTKFHILQSLWV